MKQYFAAALIECTALVKGFLGGIVLSSGFLIWTYGAYAAFVLLFMLLVGMPVLCLSSLVLGATKSISIKFFLLIFNVIFLYWTVFPGGLSLIGVNNLNVDALIVFAITVFFTPLFYVYFIRSKG